jgi:phosphatidylserine decarboxylase
MRLFVLILIVIIVSLVFFFYRFPGEREYKADDANKVYSPAYGRVMKIKERDDGTLYMAIFLSPVDIHYQFFPVSGTVKKIDHDHTGKFELAYEFNKSNKNEKCIHVINNKYGDFTVYQIAGFLVRRISTYDTVGQEAISGGCMGLIHFGSRVDIIIPQRNRFNLLVAEGDYVGADNTILGYY